MKVLFLTQSGSLSLFEALQRNLSTRVTVERAGFVIADAWHYLNWLPQNPNFEKTNHLLLKEWEITARRNDPVDLSALRSLEQELGHPGLFATIFADRRWIMGPDCTFTQDYRRRFSDPELFSMLYAAVRSVEKMFDELKPDLVCGFICVTVLDYIAYLFARSRKIRYLNLRAARIGSNVFFGSTLHDPTPELARTYSRVETKGSPRIESSREHLSRMRAETMRYEGTVAVSTRPAQQPRRRPNPISDIARVWRKHLTYRSSVAATDNHSTGIFRPLLFHTIFNPIRAWLVERTFSRHYVRPSDLQNQRYAFFPLHTEPEVSLLLYGRPFVNQIEAIRAFATSLPIDMMLVVKEHPWMVGKRTPSAYHKMLDIPRVRLAPPDTESRSWVAGASLVTVIGGSIGFEAAVLKVPVITLGHVSYNLLPQSMVRRATDLTLLPITIEKALAEHRHNEAALEAFVAALLETSVEVNLYSNLLGRSGVFADQSRDFDLDVARLAEYLMKLLATAPSASHPSSGPW